MSLPVRALTLLALFVSCAFAATSQTQSAAKEPNSSLSGKVTIKGKPAAGILIGMHPNRTSSAPAAYRAITNEDGVYRINHIANGSYQVKLAAPALVPADGDHPDRQIIVFARESTIENMNFDLVPGGAVTGKVTDSDGRPLIQMTILLQIVTQPNQSTVWPSSPYSVTDDRGVYRLFGIPAGHYKIAAVDPRRISQTLPKTYYPDVQAADKASIIEVAEGSEVADVNIKVGPPPATFAVSGEVVDESGQPVPKVTIGLNRLSDDGNSFVDISNNSTRSDQQGRFRISIPAGKYSLSSYAPEGSDLQADDPVELNVDEDIDDVVLTMSNGALISGSVVFEGAKPTPAIQSRLMVLAYKNDDSGGFSWGEDSGVKPDGSFVIGGAKPGTVKFGVATYGMVRGNGGFSLVRIERDGVIQPNGIQIQAKEHVTGLRLFVTHTSGSISGEIKTNGAPPRGGRLFVQVL